MLTDSRVSSPRSQNITYLEWFWFKTGQDKMSFKQFTTFANIYIYSKKIQLFSGNLFSCFVAAPVGVHYQ